jgi:hypothetical protein
MYLRGVKRVAKVRRVDFPPHRRKSKGLAHLRETDRVAKVVSPALAALLFYRREKPLSPNSVLVLQNTAEAGVLNDKLSRSIGYR